MPINRKSFYKNQSGVAQIIFLVVLVVGLIVALVVVQNRTQLFPKADAPAALVPSTTFSLNSSKTEYKIGDSVPVQVVAHSDNDNSNLFIAKINFDKTALKVDKIDTNGSFVTNWVEQFSDNDNGKISLTGGVPDPGFKSIVNDTPVMATVYFTALKNGSTAVNLDSLSAIYRNADNENIITAGNSNLTLNIGDANPSSVACSACGADINKSGKVEIVDFSAVSVCMSKGISGTYGDNQPCSNADTNKDGVIDQKDVTCVQTQFNATCSANGSGTSGTTTPGTPVIVCTACSADINKSGKVDILDFSIASVCSNSGITGTYGDNQSCSNANIFGTGVVDQKVVDCVQTQFNNTCPANNPSPVTVLPAPAPFCTACVANISKSGKVDITDFSAVSVCMSKGINGTYGDNKPCSNADTNKDGVVDQKDADCTIAQFGNVCAPVGTIQNTVSLSSLTLKDLSGLLTDFNKQNGFKNTSDLNGDKVVNSIDFSIMRGALVTNGVIKAN